MRLWLACALLLPLGCRSTTEGERELAPALTVASVNTPVAAPGPPAKQYGAGITLKEKQRLAEVLKAPESFAGKTVLVEGHVRKACSRKGCWMELAEGSGAQAPGCRVTFKDYGFFVPTDSAGSTALVEAAVEIATVKARHVEHLEEEGATFAAKQSDGTAREVRLVATGVELRRL